MVDVAPTGTSSINGSRPLIHQLAFVAIDLTLTVLLAELLDARVLPRDRPLRRGNGLLLRQLVATILFGLGLMLTGTPGVAAAIASSLVLVLVIASNLKHATLGEPLLFTDLAVAGAFLRYPRFYLQAVPIPTRIAVLVLAPAGVWLLAATFSTRALPHLLGLALAAGGAGLLVAILRTTRCRALMTVPDPAADMRRHGLIATLLIYWLRWRRTADPPELPAEPGPVDAGSGMDGPELLVIVQCESFMDTADLSGAVAPLAALARARMRSSSHGRLMVSGFGAYTMRTEYGVLFGRDEPALGFRRFDPFLTAGGERSHALPHRLSAWFPHAVFLHPHDLRFYRRDRLMPQIGFDLVLGPGQLGVLPTHGPYTADEAVGGRIASLIAGATCPTLIYAVTMENHGPWNAGRLDGLSGLDAYLAHLRNGDALLGNLIETMERTGRRGTLVFFGDHRPSIPGTMTPGGDRHTPYVLLRFPPDDVCTEADLSPAGLHDTIIRHVRRGPNLRNQASTAPPADPAAGA